jgi:PKD repeat protein
MTGARRLTATGVGLALCALAATSCQELPEIPNDPPTATFIYSPVSPIGAGNTAVQFNATGSRDRDGSIVRYRWDFGDGTVAQEGASPIAAHVFPDTPAFCAEIVYGVLLTVTDDDGDTAVASQNVRVVELPAPTAVECLPDPRR